MDCEEKPVGAQYFSCGSWHKIVNGKTFWFDGQEWLKSNKTEADIVEASDEKFLGLVRSMRVRAGTDDWNKRLGQ